MIALRRLHDRWFHAPIAHMTKLLTAAGVQGPATHVRLVDSFNTEVQVDLLFYRPTADLQEHDGVDCASHH
eukprot:3397012-Amphidinium_carterae.1